MIKVIFLGTNGWYDTDTGNTVCILVETPKEYIVLDAGNGIYKLDQYVKTNKPIHLFLSHFHLDHIIGLHILAKFKFKQGINIYVPKGGGKFINNFIDRPLTAPIRMLPTAVRIFEFPSWAGALRLQHIEPCFGFRFNLGRKILSYCPDTGPCENAVKLSRGADLLIAECAFKAGQNNDAWPHLNPETAATIAKEAKAKKLVLVHFDAEIYKALKDRKIAQAQAKRIFKNVIAATDDMEITA